MFNYNLWHLFFCFKANWSEISLFDFMVANCLYALKVVNNFKIYHASVFYQQQISVLTKLPYHYFYQWKIPALFTSWQFSQIFSLFVKSANICRAQFTIFTLVCFTWCDIDWKTGHIFVLCWCVYIHVLVYYFHWQYILDFLQSLIYMYM